MLLVVACQGPELPDAEVTGVTPSRVWRGADVPVTIEGSSFFPGIEVDARGFGADLDRDWQAFLVGGGQRLALAGEALESDEQLRALVPAGFEPGIYTVDLVSPAGDDVASEVTLEVTESQEAAFSVSYFDPAEAYVAGEQARFLIEAVGLDNEQVFTDVPVAVRLDGAAAELSTTVAFDDVEVLPGGRGFTGVLPDGAAVLVLDLLSPGRLDVIAESPAGAPDLQQATLTLVVGGGSDLPATVELPAEVVTDGIQAGVAFDATVTVFDELGEVVEEPLELSLSNRCGGFDADVVARGPTVVSVLVTRATQGGGCTEDFLTVTRGAVGTSDAFEVRGGEPDGFEIFTLGLDLEAGRFSTVAVVRPTDLWDNTTTWSGVLTVSDDLGSLTETSCQPAPQILVCSGTPTLAGDGVTVEVLGDDGLSAELGGYRIVPSPDAEALQVDVPAGLRAGLAADVSVAALDAYGNVQLPEQVEPKDLALQSGLGDAACTLGGVGLDGVVDFSCTFTAARPNGELVATGSGSLAGLTATAPLAVANGLLAEVEVSAPAAVEAGEAFALRLVARDAFGNAYQVQDDPVVELVDGGDGLSPSQVLLLSDGTVTAVATLTTSGTWTIDASQGGVPLGSSGPVVVSPAPTSGLQVDVDAPWGEVGVPVNVVVEAVDAYGNRTALSESLTVASTFTATPPEVLALVNGVATVSWSWTERAVDEVLEATSAGGYLGSSAPLYVVRDCGGAGPTADLLLGGAGVGLACFDEGTGVATVTGDLTGSSPGAFALIGYGIAAEGPDPVSSVGTANAIDVELGAVGRYVVRAIAVDADACADEVVTEAFVGLDDGSPTGPASLVPADAVLDVAATTTLEVSGVTDCAGDPAGGAELLVRSAAGELSGVTPTGHGLAVVLDAVGGGTVDLTTDGGVADNGPTAGSVTLAATTPDGSAIGMAALSITGDSVRPTVLDQAPRGQTSGLVDTVFLELSEGMLGASVVPGQFSLSGPFVVDVVDAQLVGTTITLTLAPPADADAGAWLLTATDDLRDASGNRISGDWSGGRADYVGAFGDVGAVPDALSCPSVDPVGGFRPDGDDGMGNESDAVTVSLESATAPAWWVVDVTDDGGALIVQHWDVPAGAADTWSWDGRDAAGFVVPSGTYTISIRPDDGFGNRGVGCVVQTVVEHPFEDP